MLRARYWLLSKIAEMPKVFTYGIGVLTAALVVMVSIVATLWLDKASVSRQHVQALRIYQAAIAESRELLAHLATHRELRCTPPDLLHLNAHLLKSHYLREIGILTPEGAVACSTALGMLDAPLKTGHPVHETRTGVSMLINVPLAISDKTLSAVIVQVPPFNTVLSPFAINEIYGSADAVWVDTKKGLALLNYERDLDTLETLYFRAQASQGADFALHGLGYELLTADPDLDLILQSDRRLSQIIRENPLLLPATLFAAVLIGGLTVGTVSPHIRRLAGLGNRLEYLCSDNYLALEYQPIFDLKTLEPVGCEVLARLKEGDTRWMPDTFISELQRAGLEQTFDLAVTRKAIRELGSHLPDLPARFAVALNYFPRSVHPSTLMPVLSESINDTGRDDFEICIEIVEHALSSELIPEVECLKSNGYLIAVDDFGTGYSNLRSVTRLAPDRLKIDRSFVHELEEASLRSNLIPEMVDIARAINAQIIAEGIETMNQARLLTVAGVRYGQGYGLARPMPADALGAMMRQYFATA